MKNLLLGALPVLVLAAQGAQAQSTPEDRVSASPPQSTAAPDNSRSNRQVPENTSNTADQQMNDEADLDVTKRIRESLMADKTLSTYGHNVKVVSIHGQVTLNGVVRSQEEKAAIGRKAAAVVGRGRIVNDLQVAAK